jgi:O-antigen ligase
LPPFDRRKPGLTTTAARWLIGWGAAILGLAWLLPGHYFPWFTFQQEFAASVGACMIGVAALVSNRGRIGWPWLSLLALAVASIPLMQLAAGQVRFMIDGVLASAYVAAFGIAVCAGATLSKDDRLDMVGAVFAAFVVAAIASVAFCLMQWTDLGTGAFVDAAPPSARFYANFGQPNNLATALAMGVCGLLIGHARGAIGNLATAVGVTFLGFGMVMTQSRTGWVFVAMLVFGMIVLRNRAQLRVPPWAVLAGGAAFVATAVAWAPLNELLLLSPQDEAANRVASGGTRPIHWAVIWDAVWQRPWAGYGWNQAVFAQQASVAHHPGTGEVLNSSHNIALDLLAWNGLPLGLLLIGAITWWFVRQFRACRSAEAAFALAAVGAVFLHGMLELALEYAFFLVPVGLLMGTLDARDPPARTLWFPRWTLGLPVLALAALTAWVGTEYVEVDRTARTMRFVAGGIGTDRVNSAPEPDVWLLDRPRQLHRYMLTPAKKSEDPHYLPWVRDVAMRHPMAPAMLRHAVAAGLNGEPAEARAVLQRLCKMHMAELCDQGRDSWAQLQKRYPDLSVVAYPPTPLELVERGRARPPRGLTVPR